MENSKLPFRLYAALGAVTSAAVLWMAGEGLERFDPSPDVAVGLAIWAAFMALAEISPIPLPRTGMLCRLTPAVDVAAMLIFGPFLAAAMAVPSRVFAFLLMAPRHPWRLMAGIGQAVLSVGLAGLAYRDLGGGALGTGDSLPGDLYPLFASLGVYFGIRNGMHLLAASLEEHRTPHSLMCGNLKWDVVHDLIFLPFGVVLAANHARFGANGVALFVVPFLIARYAYRLWSDTKRAHLATVRTLVSALDASSPFTRGHAYRVSKLSLGIGRHMGLAEDALEELEYGALLHDIGRTAIYHDVLLKAGRLDEGEKALMRTHPRIGYDILKGLRFLEGAAEIVHSHHEQPDGNGYPRGLGAEEIPVGARIVMVAAAFDALTVDRPYRRGLSPRIAVEEISKHSGTQFFPEVVRALVELHESCRLYEHFNAQEVAMYTNQWSNSLAFDEFLEEMRRNFGESGPDYIEAPASLVEAMGDPGAEDESDLPRKSA